MDGDARGVVGRIRDGPGSLSGVATAQSRSVSQALWPGGRVERCGEGGNERGGKDWRWRRRKVGLVISSSGLEVRVRAADLARARGCAGSRAGSGYDGEEVAQAECPEGEGTAGVGHREAGDVV